MKLSPISSAQALHSLAIWTQMAPEQNENQISKTGTRDFSRKTNLKHRITVTPEKYSLQSNISQGTALTELNLHSNNAVTTEVNLDASNRKQLQWRC
uniref:Uncharacterized protein n=1 Tax=Anopheles epiroticus TaxID=199890 RepID=A0A182PYS9_9DIPT